jgi:hypothetical protein
LPVDGSCHCGAIGPHLDRASACVRHAYNGVSTSRRDSMNGFARYLRAATVGAGVDIFNTDQ